MIVKKYLAKLNILLVIKLSLEEFNMCLVHRHKLVAHTKSFQKLNFNFPFEYNPMVSGYSKNIK